MRGWLAVLVLVVWGAGVALASPLDDAGVCAACHSNEVGRAVATGGHAAVLACGSCHADRRPGRTGPRHRSIPKCSSCHDLKGHPGQKGSGPGRKATRNCLLCHDVHGSTNLNLVRETILFRHRALAVELTNDAGTAPGGFTNPDAPGTGVCETCHRKTKFYRHDGTGAPHLTASCTLCHDHSVHFQPVITEQTCDLCHTDEATRLAMPSKHSGRACGSCHQQVNPTPGPGHESAEPCQSCHQDVATHAPTGEAPLPCTQCHDPHGSPNTKLVHELLTTTAGAQVHIGYDNPFGKVDGSFASASAPGTGICEVCHTTTAHYRADGTGSPHYDFSCLPCHTHEKGFAPP